MRLSAASAIVIGTAFAAAQVFGQGKDEPIKTTPCELVKHPELYNDKMVQVRGIVRTGFETQTLNDENCDAYIWLFWHSRTYNKAEEEDELAYAYIHTRSEITHPEKLDW